MNFSKLSLLGTVLLATCIAVPVIAHVVPAGADSNILAGVISRPALAYQDGDTIQYSVTVLVPAWGTGFGNTCQQENVDVRVTLPNGTVINFPTIPFINPGDSFTFNSSNDPNMAYVINHADENINHRVTATLFAASEIAHVSVDDLDNASLTRDIGTTILHPDVAISKSGDIEAFCEGVDPTVTYTYLVDNTGDEDLTSVVVTDNECAPVVYVSGDTNLDTFLNPTETWTFTCSTQLTATTLNTGTVNAAGRFTAEPVTDSSDWLVEELPPPTVSVSPDVAEICEGDTAGVELCAVVTGGVGPFSYLWSPGGATTECITVTVAGEYCVTVTDDTTGCSASACRTLTVNEKPSCLLAAVAPPVCPSTGGNFVTADVTGGTGPFTYKWAITAGAGWAIVGGQGTDTIEYSVADVADDCATFTLLVVDDNGCDTSCEIQICCVGNTFCTFTQGYWGNAGGKKCGGQTTSQLIAAALAANGGPIIVGEAGHSITFTSVQCILDLMPAGGTPAVLPAGDFTCTAMPDSLLKKFSKKESRLNNVLIGQVLALKLNVLVSDGCLGDDSGDLAGWTLQDEVCVVPFGKPDACPKHIEMPSSLVGLTVAELLDAADAALAGDTTYSLSDIYDAVTGLNEGFDECGTIVPCPVEICGNGIDDDCDGEIDEGCIS